MPHHSKTLEHIEAARDNLLEAARLLQTLLDCKTKSQQEVAEQMGLSTYALSRYLNKGFQYYIKAQMLSVPDLEDAYRTTRSPADLLLIDIFALQDKDKKTLVMLPEYDEDTLWDKVFEFLTPREREIVLYKFGQTDGVLRTLSETARELHVSTSLTSALYQHALKTLRQPGILKTIFPATTYVLPEYLRLLTQQAQEAISMAEEAKRQYALRNNMTDIAEAYNANTPPENKTEEPQPVSIAPRKHDIRTIALSTRVRNALLRAQIYYLEDVPPDYPDSFKYVRNLGRISRKELHDALKRYTGVDRPDLLK